MYLIVRQENHIDDRYWLIVDETQANNTYNEILNYWLTQYGEDWDEDRVISYDGVKGYQGEDSFVVTIRKIIPDIVGGQK